MDQSCHQIPLAALFVVPLLSQTEDVLRQIFETTGHVQNVKIIPDKNVGAVSISLLFVSDP
jgi:hypothetical protein